MFEHITSSLPKEILQEPHFILFAFSHSSTVKFPVALWGWASHATGKCSKSLLFNTVSKRGKERTEGSVWLYSWVSWGFVATEEQKHSQEASASWVLGQLLLMILIDKIYHWKVFWDVSVENSRSNRLYSSFRNYIQSAPISIPGMPLGDLNNSLNKLSQCPRFAKWWMIFVVHDSRQLGYSALSKTWAWRSFGFGSWDVRCPAKNHQIMDYSV